MRLEVRKLGSVVFGVASAALWLFIGLWMVRLLIRLARMVPTRCAASAPSRN
jgi:hypothetical protein